MNLKNKTFLITGGNGFIGSFIANKLMDLNLEVIILSNIEEYNWRIQDINKCEFEKCDITNKSEVKRSINKIKPDIIFHLAGYVNPERNINVTQKGFSVNLIGTQNLILSLMEHEYDLFVNTGSSDEYGYNIAPFIEEMRERPVSPYSASKVAATYYCEMISYIYNKPIITVRPFLPYGPKQLAKLLVPWLIFSSLEKREILLTPCEQTRDFIYIDDVAEAYISLAKNTEKVRSCGVFNIGSGEEVQIIRIVNLIKDKLKSNKIIIGGKDYRAGEAMHFYSSIDKIKKITGWAPKWSIDDGIETTINWWFQNEKIWKKYKYIWD